MMWLGFRALGLVVSRETQHMGVPYYVDKSFEKEYRGASLDELEQTIESDYIEHLQSSCWKEKQQSKWAAHWAETRSLFVVTVNSWFMWNLFILFPVREVDT